MNLIKLSLILLVSAVILGCNTSSKQKSDDNVPFSNMLAAEQVQQKMQEIYMERMQQELLEACQTYQGFYTGAKDDNLNPNCFTKAEEICNLTLNIDNQHYIFQQRVQHTQQAACALWQPYTQKIWQSDSPPQNVECFELHAAFRQSEEIQEKYRALCNERQ